MYRTITPYATALFTTLLAIAPASAQRKPDPPAWPPPEPPRQSEVTPEFLQAYKSAGSPRLLIFTYLVSLDESRAAELNEVGVASAFNARLQQMFMHPNVTIKDLTFGELKGKQSFTDGFLRRVNTNQLAGARWLAAEADADVVLFVTLSEQIGRADGAGYSASYIALDAQRDQRFGTWSWDMYSDQPDASFSATRLGSYARAIAERVYRDFELHFAADWTGAVAREFSLVVSGVPDDQLAAFREMLKHMDGIQEVLRPRYDTAARNPRLLCDVRYTGDAFDLSMDLRRRSTDLLDMGVFVGQAREGRIVLRAYPQTMTAEEKALAGVDLPSDRRADAEQVRERFTTVYRDHAAPYVAVMINKEALQPAKSVDPTATEPAEHSHTTVSTGGGTPIVVSPQIFVDSVVAQGSSNTGIQDLSAGVIVLKDGRQVPADELADEHLLNTQIMENGILERLSRLEVRRKDLQQAWRLLASEQKLLPDKIWDDRELARLLGEKAGADIVISGTGRVARNHADGALEVLYTLRAYALENAEVVASCTVHTIIDPDAFDLRSASDNLAAEATGKLAAQMMRTWQASANQ